MSRTRRKSSSGAEETVVIPRHKNPYCARLRLDTSTRNRRANSRIFDLSCLPLHALRSLVKMATPVSRARALALYRSLLRCGRRWPGSAEEQKYILDESRSCFRENRNLSNTEDITKKLDDGEVRLQLGWHYKIPYPRLHNLPSGTVAEKPRNVTLPVYEVPSQFTA